MSNSNTQPKSVQCPRCQVPKTYLGTKRFHEGRRYGILGDLGELFINKETFDVYACSRCGSVEFFVDGIGEHLRGEHIVVKG
jgi:Zn finger protein HypA/HybF involved in hydrogenase expression